MMMANPSLLVRQPPPAAQPQAIKLWRLLLRQLRLSWAAQAEWMPAAPNIATGLCGIWRLVLPPFGGAPQTASDDAAINPHAGLSVVTLASHALQLHELKLVGYGEWQEGRFVVQPGHTESCLLLEGLDECGEHRRARVRVAAEGMAPFDLFEALSRVLPGDRFELIGKYASDHRALPLDYWRTWLLGAQEPRALEHQRQYAALHLAIAATLASALTAGILPADATVVDAGCGPGWLLALLHEHLNAHSQDHKLRLVGFDLQPESVAAARYLARNNGFSFQVEQADVHYLSRFMSQHGLKPHAIICSGVLTRCVLANATTAKNVLTQIAQVLAPGGLLVVTGRAPCYLDAADFSTVPLRVLNMHDPLSGNYFYILKQAKP